MTSRPVETLPEPRTAEQARRNRNVRRVVLGVLAAFVLAGLTGWLGVRTATVADTAGPVELRVEYPRVSRAGLAVPLVAEVRRAGGFPGPVELAVSQDLFALTDHHDHIPEPIEETSDGQVRRLTFAAPDGELFRWSHDAAIGTNRGGSMGTYRIQVYEGDQVRAEVSFRVVVLP